MSSPPDIFARIYRRHGHRCPMSTLGGRLGMAAAARLPAGEKSAVYLIRTCALDGIAETLGCSETAGSLRVEEKGEHRLSVAAGRIRLEAALTPRALEVAARYRLGSETLEGERTQLSAAELRRREAFLETVLDDVLQTLWQAPEAELVTLHVSSPAE